MNAAPARPTKNWVWLLETRELTWSESGRFPGLKSWAAWKGPYTVLCGIRIAPGHGQEGRRGHVATVPGHLFPAEQSKPERERRKANCLR